VISFTPRPLHPSGKNPRYPLDRKLGGTQSRFDGRCGEEKIPTSAGNRTLAVHRAALPNELSRLLSLNYFWKQIKLTCNIYDFNRWNYFFPAKVETALSTARRSQFLKLPASGDNYMGGRRTCGSLGCRIVSLHFFFKLV
jgi:hypothetical protein